MITLRWDPELEWWHGHAEIASGHLIEVSVAPPIDARWQPTWSARARALFDGVARDDRRIRDQVARRLLSLYNSTWRAPADPALDENSFAARLSLKSLGLEADGTAELFYQDGGLFRGHSVVASLDRRLAVTDVDVAG